MKLRPGKSLIRVASFFAVRSGVYILFHAPKGIPLAPFHSHTSNVSVYLPINARAEFF
jgi:hypothetical protein